MREDFAFETTLASRAFAPWLDSLKVSEYRVHLVFLSLPNPELAVARVAERVRQGGHDVPESVVQRRFTAGLRNFFTLYRAVADTWQVFDTSELTGPRLIASGRGTSRVEIVDGESWRRLVEIQQ
jgi:predicted ABC-type ATPase